MTEIINLRRARKARTRDQAATEAAANRVRYGRTKAETARDDLAEARARRHLDGHWRDENEDAGPEGSA